MVRKKTVGRNPASTAARFRDLEGVVTSNDDTDASPVPVLSESRHPMATAQEYDDPALYSFPFNYIYGTQDFLNDQLTYSKFIQILCIVYLGQVFYSSQPPTWEFWEKIAMNYTGVVISMFISYRLNSQKALAGNGPEAVLPEFNLLIVLIIPQFLCIMNDFYVIENLTYNYFAINSLPPLFNGFIAIVYCCTYGDLYQLKFYLRELVAFAIFKMLLEYVNVGQELHEISSEVVDQEIDYDLVNVEDGKVILGLNRSLSASEVHLILIGLMNLVFHLQSDDVVLIILQKLIIGVLVSLIVSFPVFKVYKNGVLVIFPIVFYASVQYQLSPYLGNSISWLISEIHNNLELFITWVVVLSVNIFIIFNVNIEFNLRRKIWHFLVVATILPSLILNHSFTKLGVVGLLIILLIVETIRVNKFTVIGQCIYDKLYKFQDFKDLKGPLNLLYIYLIIGISIPILLDTGSINLKQFIGVISLGLCDSIASIVGKKWGQFKYKGSNKTVEGSIGFFISSFVGYFALLRYLNTEVNYEILFIVNFLSSLFEGTTDLNDNLVLSLFSYVLWKVLETVY